MMPRTPSSELSASPGKGSYESLARRYQPLAPEEEARLIEAWQVERDSRAANRVVAAHIPLVARVAARYRAFGLPTEDLVAEGAAGLLTALDRFDLRKGTRFGTYARWWVRSAIQHYVKRFHSIVRMPQSPHKSRALFQLRGAKARLHILDDTDLTPEQVQGVVDQLGGIPRAAVLEANDRLTSRDQSLNAPFSHTADIEFQDMLPDDGAGAESAVIQEEMESKGADLIEEGLKKLSPRDKEIFCQRRLSDAPPTLEALAKAYGLTRERIRQIEQSSFIKVSREVRRRSVAVLGTEA